QAACQGIRRVPSGGIGECRTSKLNSRSTCVLYFLEFFMQGRETRLNPYRACVNKLQHYDLLRVYLLLIDFLLRK
ncbi:hypothetical protein, partial [Aeromonas allosaccharophila]|uniref:hypothetical protein n=1 Tax=Aeromonas allosaccharophila TaxID=656 RepID=UPI00300663EC